MQDRSLARNVVFYGIKTIVSIIFPLVTYKYAAYCLGSENVGEVEFAKSFINYFLLLANLGINSFAIRNGAGVRDDKMELSIFANKVFGINCVSACFAFLVYLIISNLDVNIKIDKTLGYIFLTQIPLSLMGIEWLYSIYEDYKYITYVSLAGQGIAMIFMFLFVRIDAQPLYYAIALVIASHGACVLNWIRGRKLIKIRPILGKACLPLLYPILVLFANSIATSIYVSLDISMLGFMKSSTDVGVYSSAVKVYTAIKMVIATTLTVALPRMSYYSQKGSTDQFNEIESNIINFLICMVPACVAGVICQAHNIILLISGPDFGKADKALMILGVALFFSTFGMLCGSTILLPDKKENIVLISTVVGAIVNFVLNLFLIPWIGIYGAAATTLISEFFVGMIQLIGSMKRLRHICIDYLHSFFPTIIGIIIIVLVNVTINRLIKNYIHNIIASISLSVILYGLILYFFRNKFIITFVARLKKMDRR